MQKYIFLFVKITIFVANMEKFLSRYRVPIIVGVLLCFAGLYVLLSFVNHWMFRTYGLDLGLYTKTLYDHAHLRMNDCSFYLWQPGNQFGDHFDLYLVLLSPLVYVFGEYTLLIVQLLALVMGLWGIYKLARLYTESEVIPMLAMLLLGLNFGVWHAMAFDYHSNVVSALMLPWLLYFVKKEQPWGVVLMAFAMSIAKETSALWVVFVLLALLWDWRHNRLMRRVLGYTTLGCVLYFVVVTMWVMPSFGSGRGFWRYEWMGNGMSGVAKWVLSHPLEAIRDFFTNFTPDATGDGLKTEFFICVLLSGGLFLFVKPNYLLMIIPPVAMKMLAGDVGFWGITWHYNVEVAVVSAVAVVMVLCQNPHKRLAQWCGVVAVLLTFGTLIYTTDTPLTIIRKENLRVFDARHYHQPEFDVKAARRMIEKIPDNASVCATTMFTPHVAARDSVYIFPMGLAYGADYYLMLRHHWCYYEGEEDQVNRIINDTVHYRLIDTDGSIYLMKTVP
ncbi:MAG: DUF2079 domain-containing protein [Muribaculaceae bacterium]|nr:DUF2079 domain-containing protein [Muribaculaceae bacterium]